MCLAGDIRQTLPITTENTLDAAIRNDIRRDPGWRSNLKVFTLHEPMRNRADPEFAAAVDAIGNGVADGPLPVERRGDAHHVYIPRGVRIIEGSGEEAMRELRALAHPHLERGREYTVEAARRVICSPLNATVDAHNAACEFDFVLRIAIAPQSRAFTQASRDSLATQSYFRRRTNWMRTTAPTCCSCLRSTCGLSTRAAHRLQT